MRRPEHPFAGLVDLRNAFAQPIHGSLHVFVLGKRSRHYVCDHRRDGDGLGLRGGVKLDALRVRNPPAEGRRRDELRQTARYGSRLKRAAGPGQNARDRRASRKSADRRSGLIAFLPLSRDKRQVAERLTVFRRQKRVDAIGLLAAGDVLAGAKDLRNALAARRIGLARDQTTDDRSPRPFEIALSMMSATTPRSTSWRIAGSRRAMIALASCGGALR